MSARSLSSLPVVLAVAISPLVTTACDVFVVQGRATADGSIILVGLYQWSDTLHDPYCIMHADRQTYPAGSLVTLSFREIPQVERTWAYNYVHGRWRAAERSVPSVVQAINEWGVAIASNSLFCGEVREKEPDGVDFFDVNRLVAERACSARQGVELIGHLLDTYGYALIGKDRDDGQLWVVADCREAWVVECLGGHQWVARRIEEDFFNGSNAPTITDRFDLGSDVARYADQRGWTDSSTPFNWARDFAPAQSGWQDRYQTIRQSLTGSDHSGRTTPQRIMELLRSEQFTRVKGFDQIQSAMIAHLRPNVPREFSAMAHFAVGPDAGERPFVPLYAGDQAVWRDNPANDVVLKPHVRVTVPHVLCTAFEHWALRESLAIERESNAAAQRPAHESRQERLRRFHESAIRRAAEVYAQVPTIGTAVETSTDTGTSAHGCSAAASPADHVPR